MKGQYVYRVTGTALDGDKQSVISLLSNAGARALFWGSPLAGGRNTRFNKARVALRMESNTPNAWAILAVKYVVDAAVDLSEQVTGAYAEYEEVLDAQIPGPYEYMVLAQGTSKPDGANQVALANINVKKIFNLARKEAEVENLAEVAIVLIQSYIAVSATRFVDYYEFVEFHEESISARPKSFLK